MHLRLSLMTLGRKRKVRCGMRVLEWVDDKGVFRFLLYPDAEYTVLF